jgi:hypothetical protein
MGVSSHLIPREKDFVETDVGTIRRIRRATKMSYTLGIVEYCRLKKHGGRDKTEREALSFNCRIR